MDDTEQTAAAATPHALAREQADTYLRTALVERIRANPENSPNTQVDPRQLVPPPMVINGGNARRTMLGVYAQQGVTPPSEPGDALAALGLLGSRESMKPDILVKLPLLDPKTLPPLNQERLVSGYQTHFPGSRR